MQLMPSSQQNTVTLCLPPSLRAARDKVCAYLEWSFPRILIVDVRDKSINEHLVFRKGFLSRSQRMVVPSSDGGNMADFAKARDRILDPWQSNVSVHSGLGRADFVHHPSHEAFVAQSLE